MHQSDIRQIAKQLTEIINHAKIADIEPGKRFRYISNEHGSFVVLGEYIEKFDDFIRNLLERYKWSEKYSEKHLTKLIEQTIACILEADEPKEVELYIADIVSTYENYSEEHRVYIPLSGIRLELNKFKIGKVVLRVFNDRIFREELRNMRRIVSTMRHNEEQKKEIIEKNMELLKGLHNKVCAEFSVVAEPRRTLERAEDETRRIIDLLRFATPAIYSKDLNVAVGIDGEIHDITIRTSPVLSMDVRSFNFYFERVGALSPFVINKDTIKRMRETKILHISDILNKPTTKISNFEDSILRGVHWLASATIQKEDANRFLNLITCLETYLTPRDGNPIGTAIAEGVAIITGKDLQERKRLKRRIKELYSSRSGISHGGNKSVLDKDVLELLDISWNLTIWMIRHKNKYQSTKQLLEWIEEQKLT